MRKLADAPRIERFMAALADRARAPATVYFTGGATAVLYGWREATIDVDIKLVPEADELLRALPLLKESIEINVELASPLDFIPVRDGWEERSPMIGTRRLVTYRHFDLEAQALAKVERSHELDLVDIRELIGRGLVDPARVRGHFAAIEGELHRFPAIDPAAFRRAVAERFGASASAGPR